MSIIIGELKGNDIMKEKTKKETMQQSLDVGEYVATLEKQLNAGFTGTIINVQPETNKSYFGSDTYDERDGVKITVLVDDKDKTEFSNWIGLPNVRGYEKSNLFAFKRKYNDVPRVNSKVEVIIDDNGFFRIKY